MFNRPLGIQEFHRKYVLVPVDNAANNVDVVCFHCFQKIKLLYLIHYVNNSKQELGGTRAYQEIDSDETSVVNGHLNALPVKFSVCVSECQDKLPAMDWLQTV